MITVIQGILIALLYYIAQSPFVAGVGFFTLWRPLVSGTIVGFILGDPVTGTIVGGTINLLYLGWIAAGGAIPGDIALAGTLGTAIAITAGLDPEAALAIAVPIGMLGTLVFFGRMTIGSVFVHWADAYARKGDTRGVMLTHIVPSQILLFTITFFPVFLAVMYGPAAIEAAIAFLGARVFGILRIVGGMLPALGIALNLKLILKGSTIPYFFIGFLLAVIFELDIIIVAMIAVAAAAIHMQLTSKKGGTADEGVSG